MTPIERHFRELIAYERIRALAAELVRIEDASPKAERIRFRQAVIYLIRASDRLHAAAAPAPETDLEMILRLSIARIQAQRARRQDDEGLIMEGGVE